MSREETRPRERRSRLSVRVGRPAGVPSSLPRRFGFLSGLPRAAARLALVLALLGGGALAISGETLAQTEVQPDWSLVPTGLSGGDRFRLLVVTSTRRDATATDIAAYNSHVRTAVASGHTDIRSYSASFNAVGCTDSTSARANTGTTYTETDAGVPIYWLNGAKAADDYADFYDGSWESNVLRDEDGDTLSSSGFVFAGCGTDGFKSTVSFLGNTVSETSAGATYASGVGNGLYNANVWTNTFSHNFYALSPVFRVAGSNTAATGRPAITGTTTVGRTLTAAKGTIADADGTSKADAGEAGFAYTWQWVRVSSGTETDIAGATSETYTLAADDQGKTIKVEASFSDDAGNAEGPLASAETATIGARPANSTAGDWTRVTGRAAVGRALRADTSLITDSNGRTKADAGEVGFAWTYQWKRGTSDIAGATSETYTLASADAGFSIGVTASFTDDDGYAESVTSPFRAGPVVVPTTGNAACPGDTAPPGADWTACLTVGSQGVLRGFSADNFGSITSNTFTQSTNTLSVGGLELHTTTGRFTFELAAGFNERASGTMLVGGTPLRLGDASYDSDASEYSWNNSGLSWSNGQKVTVVLSSETDPPTFSSAAITSSKPRQLKMTFSEPLAASVPDKAQFHVDVKVDATSPAARRAVSSVSIDGSVVTLTMAEDFVKNEQVTVRYDKPGSGNLLADLVGNAVETFPARTVTNGTTAYCPAASPPSGTFWNACLTVGNIQNLGIYGVGTDDGALSDKTFTFDANNYEIAGLVQNAKLIHVTFTSNPKPALDNWILRVHGTDHAFSSSTTCNNNHRCSISTPIRWSSSNVGDKVLVSLRALGAPDAPTGLSATPGDGQARLEWTAPADNGSAIVRYEFQQRTPPGSGSWSGWTSTGATATGHTVAGLNNGTAYEFRVRAVNGEGAGPESGTATATPTAAASGRMRINLDWDAPASDGGSPVTGYRIEVSADGGTSWADLEADTGNTDTDYAHTGLSPDTARHYRVSAINAVGTGSPSNVDGATTDAAAAAPQVKSIVRQAPPSSPTDADSLTWRVTFSEDVKNVDATDFAVTGTTAQLRVREVTASTVYDVTAFGGDLANLNGTVTLGFSAGQDIRDLADNPLAATAPTGTDESSYAVANAAAPPPSGSTVTLSAYGTTFAVAGETSVVPGNTYTYTYTYTYTFTRTGAATPNVVPFSAILHDTSYGDDWIDRDGGNCASSRRPLCLGLSGFSGDAFGTVPGRPRGAYGRSWETRTQSSVTVTVRVAPDATLGRTFVMTMAQGSAVAPGDLEVTIDRAPSVPSAGDPPSRKKAIPDQAAMAGIAFHYQFPEDTFVDPEGGPLTYSYNLPNDDAPWLRFDPAQRTFFGTPQDGDAAKNAAVLVTATDVGGRTAQDVFHIGVHTAGNLYFRNRPDLMREGGETTYEVVLQNPPAVPVTVSVASADPGRMTVEPATLRFEPGDSGRRRTVTVRVPDGITANAVVTVTHSGAGVKTKAFTVAVFDVPRPSAEALVGNLGQARSAGVGAPSHDFTTGDAAGGYILDSIELDLSWVGQPRPSYWPANRDWNAHPSQTRVTLAPAEGGPEIVLVPRHPESLVVGVNAFMARPNTRLEPGTRYRLTVACHRGGSCVSMRFTTSTAEDAGGADGWSIADNPKTSIFVPDNLKFRVNGRVASGRNPPRHPPGPPTVSAEPGDGQVTLSWKAPENGGGGAAGGGRVVGDGGVAGGRRDVPQGDGARPRHGNGGITGWQARHGAADAGTGIVAWGGWTGIEGAETASHTVTGLENGAFYAFQVRALAGAVEGVESATLALMPMSESGLNPPRDLAASNAGPRSIALSWVLPGQSGGVTATGVEVQQQAVDGSWTTVASLAADASAHTVTGLSPGTEYGFRIRLVAGRTPSRYGRARRRWTRTRAGRGPRRSTRRRPRSGPGTCASARSTGPAATRWTTTSSRSRSARRWASGCAASRSTSTCTWRTPAAAAWRRRVRRREIRRSSG